MINISQIYWDKIQEWLMFRSVPIMDFQNPADSKQLHFTCLKSTWWLYDTVVEWIPEEIFNFATHEIIIFYSTISSAKLVLKLNPRGWLGSQDYGSFFFLS